MTYKHTLKLLEIISTSQKSDLEMASVCIKLQKFIFDCMDETEYKDLTIFFTYIVSTLDDIGFIDPKNTNKKWINIESINQVNTKTSDFISSIRDEILEALEIIKNFIYNFTPTTILGQIENSAGCVDRKMKKNFYIFLSNNEYPLAWNLVYNMCRPITSDYILSKLHELAESLELNEEKELIASMQQNNLSREIKSK